MRISRNRHRHKKIQCLYQNVRGLRSKTALFNKNVTECNHDVIALTETFLTSSVSDSELFPSNYTIIRKDRIGDAGWGGVLLAIRDCYIARPVVDIDGLTSDMELIFVNIKKNNLNILCCVTYLPPSYNDEQYLNVLTCIENTISSNPDLHILILGDFNLNSCSANVKTHFEHFQEFCGLRQHNNILNVNGGMLDLVLSDLASDLITVSIGDPLVPIDVYHPPLELTLKLSYYMSPPSLTPQALPIEMTMTWDWRKADYEALYRILGETDWSDLYKVVNVDSAVDIFYSKLYDIINSFVPLKKRHSHHAKYAYPKWYTDEIKHILKCKYFHLKRYKSEGKEFNKELFKYYRQRAKYLIDNAYQQHLRKVQTDIIDDPVHFWEYVKNKRKNRRHIDTFKFGGEEVTGQAAVNAFAQYFGSVFQDDKPRLDVTEAIRATYSQLGVKTVTIGTVDEGDLVLALRRLRARSSAGPDGIPIFLIKDCFPVLKDPLLFLFNSCLTQSTYPDYWKLSRVTPVPKGEPDVCISSYRPIAILSVFAKLFEAILNLSISRQIDSSLHDDQHGFRKARSTVTNLVTLTDYVYAEMDAGHQVDAAYFDFRKAFDLVDNDILLRKMAIMGFMPDVLKFFASYLENRRQFVRINGYTSQTYYTRSGVSQGSTLGPTLFLIMVNDLPEIVCTAKCLLFADDFKLYLGVSNDTDVKALQEDIDSVAVWSQSNRLPFNTDKCKCITFARKRNPIQTTYRLFDATIDKVGDIRDLGVVLDSKLDFHKHMTDICKKASKTMGFVIRTSSEFDNTIVAKVLYSTYVRSRLEYGAIVWSPYETKYESMIEKIQRKFTRWLYKRCFGYYPYLYPSLFVSGMVEIETLALRRKILLIKHYLSVLHSRIDSPQVLEKVGLLVPARIQRDASGIVAPRRRPRLLQRHLTRTVHASQAPSVRGLRLVGDMLTQYDELDLFTDSLARLLDGASKFLNFV